MCLPTILEYNDLMDALSILKNYLNFPILEQVVRQREIMAKSKIKEIVEKPSDDAIRTRGEYNFLSQI